jgi:hypothetical protein
MATTAIAPLIASGVWLVRAPRWRFGPTLVFVVSTIVFTGSHNITLLWGSTAVVLAALILWLALGMPRRLPIRRLAMLGGLGAASLAVNAWYLLPDIGYQQDVRAHLQSLAVGGAHFFDTPQVLFDPLRSVPAESTTPALYVQIPVWFLVWGLVTGIVLMWRRRSEERLRRFWIGMVALIGVLLAMLMITPLWSIMPFPFSEIQFPYRLGSYVFYAIAGLVLVNALALERSAREKAAGRAVKRLRVGLLAVCAVSVGLCVWQQWAPSTLFPGWSYTNREEALASVNQVPRTWYDPHSYNDIEAPVVTVPAGRELSIEPSAVHGDRFAAWMQAPAGLAPIQTNIAGGSYLVKVSGLVQIGRDAEGYAVVRREREGSGPVHVVVQTASSAGVVLGRAISIVGCIAVLAILAWTCMQGFIRARRSTR